MENIYRQVVDEMFNAVILDVNKNKTREQIASAMANHLAVYFVPRMNLVEGDNEIMDRFRATLSEVERGHDER